MEDPDLLKIVLGNLNFWENSYLSNVNKNFNNCVNYVINEKLKLWRSFIKFKIKTVFPKNYNRKRTYYTFKNRYINKEETSILTF